MSIPAALLCTGITLAIVGALAWFAFRPVEHDPWGDDPPEGWC